MTQSALQTIALRQLRDQARARVRAGQATPALRESLRRADALLLELQHGDGCVAASKSRVTGTVVQLYRPGTQNDESEERGWFVVCKDHGSCVIVGTRKMGASCVAHPEEFCDDCREALGAKP
mgnify:CR=1 FL=1